MKYFFHNEQYVLKLRRVAAEWERTPFFAHGAVKGAGVDCVHLCAEIYRECGVFESYSFPRYTVDGGHHASASKVIEWLTSSPNFLGPCESSMMGDLLCFRIGKTAWHVGIKVTESQFIHAVERRGVMLSGIDEPTYSKRLTAIYRPIML